MDTVVVIGTVAAVIAAIFSGVPLWEGFRNRARVEPVLVEVSRYSDTRGNGWHFRLHVINRSPKTERILWVKVSRVDRPDSEMGSLPEYLGQVILHTGIEARQTGWLPRIEEIVGSGEMIVLFERAGLQRFPFTAQD